VGRAGGDADGGHPVRVQGRAAALRNSMRGGFP
jgi:hypothetical protein